MKSFISKIWTNSINILYLTFDLYTLQGIAIQKQWAAVITNLKNVLDFEISKRYRMIYTVQNYQAMRLLIVHSTYLWFSNAPPHNPLSIWIRAIHGRLAGSYLKQFCEWYIIFLTNLYLIEFVWSLFIWYSCKSDKF